MNESNFLVTINANQTCNSHVRNITNISSYIVLCRRQTKQVKHRWSTLYDEKENDTATL